jgi:hypothetical protein
MARGGTGRADDSARSGATPRRDNEDIMAKTINLSLNEDELEILIDALEADMEGYQDSAKEARGNSNREDVATFTEAAERIAALIEKLRKLNPEG